MSKLLNFTCFFIFNDPQYVSIVLYEVKSDNNTHNQAIFLTIYFLAFDFIVLSDLKFNRGNLIKIILLRLILLSYCF